MRKQPGEGLRNLAVVAAVAGATVLSGQATLAQDEQTKPPFGSSEDIAFAETLWDTLGEAALVGPGSIVARPYKGTEPHGSILINLERDITVDGRTGRAIVKKNYRGRNATVSSVYTNPRENLDSITVMFEREAGYDPANGDWFWVKYGPGGTVLENQKHTKLAGKVAKGADQGCIACHRAAPGRDFIFTHDRPPR